MMISVHPLFPTRNVNKSDALAEMGTKEETETMFAEHVSSL